MMGAAQINEIDRNYDAFLAKLPDLLKEHEGRFALLHNCEVVALYNTSLEATVEGSKRFSLGKYSVQEVTGEPEHLGFYSYVGSAGAY